MKKKRRLPRMISFFLALVMLVSLIPNTAFAVIASGQCGDNAFWKLDESGMLSITGSGAMYSYNRIENDGTADTPWYQYRQDIDTVIIQSGITSVGSTAFCDFSRLTSVTIPDSVTGIGDRAFYNCSSLSGIKIPDGVTHIGMYAFYNCTSLTSVTIPEGVIVIAPGVFRGCSSLTSVTLPDGLVDIGADAFLGCRSLTSITIPDRVTSIGGSAFYQCTSLTTVTIPESITKISDYTFYFCSSLVSVTVPDTVTRIGVGAFIGCSSLASVNIPDGVTSIGDRAFYDCSSLTSVIIPDGVTSIGSQVFCGCSGLTSITIPDSVTSIGNYAFYNCTSLTSVTIPENVTDIEKCAFKGCSGLTDVKFMGSAPTFGADCFSNVNATVHYPCTDATWTDEVQQDYSGGITWVGHQFSDDVSVQNATCTVDGSITQTCSVCGCAVTESIAATGHKNENEDGRCDVCGCLMQDVYLGYITASLEGNIAVNYFMLLSDAVLADETAHMEFTMADGEIIKVPVSESKLIDGYDVFTCEVAAKEMTDIITGQFYYNGQPVFAEAHQYNVRAYAKHIIQNSDDPNAKALMEAMVNYGAASQLHFGYSTGNLANTGVTTAPDYSSINITEYPFTRGQGTNKVKLYSASLILNSETTLRLFFNGNITATYNGKSLEVKQRAGLYHVDIVNIAAKDLDKNVTITINDGTETANITFNPLSYCQIIEQESTGLYTAEMRNLAIALYLYNKAAGAYFVDDGPQGATVRTGNR